MNLLPFMRQKAVEKGIKTCSNCGSEDVFYALNGKCLECNEPMMKNDKLKSLQFSIELFTEFLEKYDEILNVEQKRTALQFLKGLIHNLSSKGFLENEKIIKLQTLVNGIDTIGSNAIGGAITIKNLVPSLQMLEDYKSTNVDPMIRIKSFGGVVLAIQYILTFEVLNEYILEKAIAKNGGLQEKSSKDNVSKNTGCLGTLALLLFSFMLILIAINIV